MIPSCIIVHIIHKEKQKYPFTAFQHFLHTWFLTCHFNSFHKGTKSHGRIGLCKATCHSSNKTRLNECPLSGITFPIISFYTRSWHTTNGEAPAARERYSNSDVVKSNAAPLVDATKDISTMMTTLPGYSLFTFNPCPWDQALVKSQDTTTLPHCRKSCNNRLASVSSHLGFHHFKRLSKCRDFKHVES